MPAIKIVFCSNEIAITTSDLHPCFDGFELKDGQLITVNSGMKLSNSLVSGLRNIVRMKRLCQASSVIIRTFNLCAGSEPP